MTPYPVFSLPADAPISPEELGTKLKFWCEEATLGRSLFKSGRSGHAENEAEKACAHLAPLMGLPAAQIELAIWDGPRGPVRGTLSPYLPPGAPLVFGNEVLEHRVRNYPARAKRTASHTVSRVMDALGGVRPHPALADVLGDAADQFVGYLLFDAWVGNMDRHHENWALAAPLGGVEKRYLAATFDHGSSLGRERTDAARQDALLGTAAEAAGAGPNPNRRTVAGYARAPKARGRLYRDGTEEALSPTDAYLEATRIRPDAGRFWRERLHGVPVDAIGEVFVRFPPGWGTGTTFGFAQALLAENHRFLLSLDLP